MKTKEYPTGDGLVGGIIDWGGQSGASPFPEKKLIATLRIILGETHSFNS